MKNDGQLMKGGSGSVLVRSQKMAAALSSYARALTFENRSRRNLYRLAGLAPRARDRVFSVLLGAVFILCFVLPFAGSVFYYGFFASPRYSSEVRFVVRSSAPLLTRDRYSSDNVEPKAKIVQDTAVLVNYIASPEMVKNLEKSIDFKEMFGRGDIDFLSRLRPDAKQEDVDRYWQNKHSAWINPKSGIVELEVVAFSPQEAYDLLKQVLKLAEERVNKLSSGMWNNLQESAERDVQTATQELETLRNKYRDMQNKTGVFDIEMAASGILSVLTKLESDIADLKSQRDALSVSVTDASPRLADLDRQIEAREEQARTLRAQTAGQAQANGGSLADYSQQFNDINLDLRMAEKKLESAISELEKVKLVSSLQLVYVDNFTEPTLPDASKYPRVALSILLSFLACTALWGVASGILLFMRQKFD
ncbi:hypothetical protein [Shinella sp. BYT-45]|uniref:hypothetical protein n=1 Tax=Shinella sp. BYT-45 TaxID=3377377 RepID=UPI00397FBFBA